ncbi:hypothetical protein, partial [Legionella sp. 28fT52]|uniref:hypothetical protein n=1 Tax=Legionella sp. 28fT52 TaxID=3410134 RepID=UPI003AF9F660
NWSNAQDDMSVIYIKIPFAYFKGDFNSIMKFFYTDLCRRFSCLQTGALPLKATRVFYYFRASLFLVYLMWIVAI